MRRSFGHAALGGATRAFSTPPRVDFEAHGMELSRNGQYAEAVHVFSRGLRAAADRSKSGESLWHHRFNAYCDLGHFHLAYADMLAMNSLGVHEPPGALFLAEMMMAKVEHEKTYSPVFLPKWIPEQRNVLEVIHQHSGFAAQHGLELRLTPDRGLGLYALRRFSANEAVLKEAPYLYASTSSCHCTLCGIFSGAPKPCTHGCGATYCSEWCRSTAWESFHCRECGYYSKITDLMRLLHEHKLPRFVLLIARLMAMTPPLRDVFDVHPTLRCISLSPSKRIYPFEQQMALYGFCLENFRMVPAYFDFSTFDYLAGIFENNMYHVPQSTDMPLECHSCAMYKVASFLNHNCVPNARTVVNVKYGNEICFLAERDISVGDEVCTSYLGKETDVKKRQTRILQYTGIPCTCQLCVNKTMK